MGKTRERIILIGPVYPYKGGISHYTGLMYRALCKAYPQMRNQKTYEDMIVQTVSREHIAIYDGYIPDKEVKKFFAASNLVVLPYVSATQSGIA